MNTFNETCTCIHAVCVKMKTNNPKNYDFLIVTELPNPCDSTPCKNDGVCLEQGETFFCDCSDTNGYRGPTCEGVYIQIHSSYS